MGGSIPQQLFVRKSSLRRSRPRLAVTWVGVTAPAQPIRSNPHRTAQLLKTSAHATSTLQATRTTESTSQCNTENLFTGRSQVCVCCGPKRSANSLSRGTLGEVEAVVVLARQGIPRLACRSQNTPRATLGQLPMLVASVDPPATVGTNAP